jgi:hypothetical protein
VDEPGLRSHSVFAVLAPSRLSSVGLSRLDFIKVIDFNLLLPGFGTEPLEKQKLWKHMRK